MVFLNGAVTTYIAPLETCASVAHQLLRPFTWTSILALKMFGTNSVPSSSSNPQQNQQLQPQDSAFGQPKPNAFGFGGTDCSLVNAFGPPHQLQSDNPTFGSLGSPGTSTSTFGPFVQNTIKHETTTPTFGFSKPVTGFSAFGAGATAFGDSRGAFSTAATTPTVGTGAFGSTVNANGTFGTGGKPVGQNEPAVVAFGGQPATGKDGTVTAVTTGTASPPYSIYSERDPSSSGFLLYQTISAMPAYRSASLEELRVQDYLQGRKPKGAFGKPSFSFGTPFTEPTSTLGADATRHATTSSVLNFRNGKFKPPLERGIRIFSHDGTRASALDIICHLLDDNTTSVQRGIVDEHDFAYNAAGEGLASALRKQSQSHDEKLQILRADTEAAMKAKDEETRQQVQEELGRRREELARIKQDVECMTERFVSEKTQLESRIAEMEATNRQYVDRLQDMQNQVSQALLQVMASQTETARWKEEEERQARLLAEERLANVLASTKRHEEVQAVQAEMNKHLYALQDEISRITLEKKGDRQRQADPESTKTYSNGQSKDRETKQKQKGKEN
ncbi:hypothetical protein F5141DRAFT_1142330 [Pisolithus sp. B1]|nr:hypothetical protein F5141DRAFT_1142330 [Pisolithus sp. B1]